MTNVQSTRGKKLLKEDPAFLRIIERLVGKEKPYFFYTNMFGFKSKKSWTQKEPFATLEEEEAEQFLKSQLSDYGFFFEQSGATGDWVTVTSKFDRSISKEFGFDTSTPAGTRKNTYDLVDFIIENARSKEEEKERRKKIYGG